MVVVWPRRSRAQESSTETITAPMPLQNESAPRSTNSNYLSVEIQQYNYNPNSSQTSDQFSQYTQLTPQFGYFYKHDANDGSQTIVKTNGLVVLPMSAGTHFEIALPDAYWAHKAGKFQISVGRKLENWSELDNFWHLGIWQPLARWDAADPMTQGLTGIFAGVTEKRYRLVLFASDIFLPDQQPDFRVRNGQIISDNRWFRAPVSQFPFGNTESNITYSIAHVNPSSVVFHPSLAAMSEIGRKNSGPFFRAAYADKPMNQFHIAETIQFITGANNTSVNVLPMVVQENVLTAEAGYRFGIGNEFVLSDNWEHFENPRLPSDYFQSELIDSQYIGALYRQNLDNILPESSIALSYVTRVKDTNPQTDTIIQGEVESSADRFSFDKLAGVQFQKRLWHEGESGLDGELGYVYSMSDAGQWWHILVNYQYDMNWTWSIAGDLLGLPPSNNSSTTFISKYRGNDRLIGGLTYVF